MLAIVEKSYMVLISKDRCYKLALLPIVLSYTGVSENTPNIRFLNVPQYKEFTIFIF